MQKRHLWLLLVVAIGVAAGYWWTRRSANVAPVVVAPPKAVPHPTPVAQPPTSQPASTPVAHPVVKAAAPHVDRPSVAPVPQPATPTPAPAPSTVAALPVAKPDVKIEENQTIDFSGGDAVVKNSTEEKAIIDKAVKEMDEATKNITFAPSAPNPAANKKAEPVQAPPK